MSTLDNQQLINLIRYAPVVVVTVFALAVNLIAIQNNREQADRSIKNLREELTLERKEAIRSEVHQVYNELILAKSKSETDLKNETKQRVYEAYGIANYIYAQNIGKSKAEITKLIIDTLRPIRFFDGRGYFFILNHDGTTILNGESPNLEGKNGWNVEREGGHFLAREMLEVTRKNGEGFINWRFKKPGQSDNKTFAKMGYIKKFEPYNWSIATGEYLTDFEADVKTKLLKWFSSYEYGENGYFFALDKNGTLLAHHANDFLGLDFVIGQKVKAPLLNEINAQINHGGGYIRYTKPLTLSGKTSLEQVSYVKEVKGWDWIIGTGFSAQAFEKNLRLKEQQYIKLNQQSLLRLIYLSIISMILLTASTLYVSHLIARRFELFKSQIKGDFDELTNTKNKMEYMALHDALTDLPNRVLLLDEIEKHMQLATAENEKLAVMFLNLDNFKNINDLYGHHVGDLLLKVVSQRFKALPGFGGNVSRFGGDEFIFLVTKLKDKNEAENKAKLILESLVKPIPIDGKSLSISCSIGVAMYPDDGTNADVLISQADTVLHQAKASKKGQILFYRSNISEQIKRKMEIGHALALAIKKEELSVHYQPQIRAVDEKLVSVEALARWEHATFGHIFPNEFISIAEETGLIHDLDSFIFKKACEDILALSPNGERALKLSVNISPAQLLESDFSDHLLVICTDVGIDPKRITLEITENIFIHDFNLVQPLLNELRELGFGLSLDDFGTGYSSLSYINNLPLTEIKIDRAFVNKFIDSHQSDMLVRMIISIGRSCNLVVVAEGVETKPQSEKLRNYGCDLMQGYYFDRPLTIAQLSKKVVNNQSKAASSLMDAINV